MYNVCIIYIYIHVLQDICMVVLYAFFNRLHTYIYYICFTSANVWWSYQRTDLPQAEIRILHHQKKMTVVDASLPSSCERFLDVSSEANTGGMMAFPVFWSADWFINIMQVFPKAIELQYFSCFIYQEWVDFRRYGHFWKDLWISQTLFNQTKRTSSLPTLHIKYYISTRN